MSVLPNQPVAAFDWAMHAAIETQDGMVLSVPVSALQALLDGYVAAKRALEEDVRAVLIAAVADGQRAEVVPYY